MFQTRRPLPLSGLSGPLMVLARLTRLLSGAALLAGALLLGLVLMAALLLRRAFRGHRAAPAPGKIWAEAAQPGTRRASGEVVDVEVREVRSASGQ
jgi:hypothetical protein